MLSLALLSSTVSFASDPFIPEGGKITLGPTAIEAGFQNTVAKKNCYIGFNGPGKEFFDSFDGARAELKVVGYTNDGDKAIIEYTTNLHTLTRSTIPYIKKSLEEVHDRLYSASPATASSAAAYRPWLLHNYITLKRDLATSKDVSLYCANGKYLVDSKQLDALYWSGLASTKPHQLNRDRQARKAQQKDKNMAESKDGANTDIARHDDQAVEAAVAK